MRNHEQAPTTGYSQAVAVIPSLQKTYTEPLSLSDTRLTHHHPPSASYIWLSGYQFTDISPITGATALARARPWRICAGFWAQPLVLPNLGGQTPSWTGPGLTLQHRCLNNQDPSKSPSLERRAAEEKINSWLSRSDIWVFIF